MSMEKLDTPEHEGDHYLRLLGLEHLANREITTVDGTFEARDFLDICGEYARPMLVGFEAMSPDDPKYEPTKNALQGVISQYIKGDSPS